MATAIEQDDDIVREFLLESRENLDRLDRELIALEDDPSSRERLSTVFRTVHTIKGTAGFLGLTKLEAITHVGENLLSRLRDGEVRLESARTTGLLAMADAIRTILRQIEGSGSEGGGHYGALIEALSLLCNDATLAEAQRLLVEITGQPAERVKSARPDLAPAPPAPAPRTSDDAPPRASAVPRPALPSTRPRPSKLPPRSTPPAARGATNTGAGAPEAASRAHDERPGDTRIRVDVGLLDRLMNLVGELVLTRNQLLQVASGSPDGNLVSSCQRLNIITTELQEGVMKTRLQPIENVWNRFPRVVRDLAKACGKQVALEMEGKTTELDKTIIEAISDPLTHLVRNAIDHGIETVERRKQLGKPPMGKLLLRAFHEGGRVNIEISDDGGGIDVDRVKAKATERGLITAERARHLSAHEAYSLIFLPGFSTAEAITNVSGRGVGMDVVKSNIERIGGSVDVDSRLTHGTTIRIKIPLTLAIIPALIVGAGGERFAIPQVNLVELVRLSAEQARTSIERIHDVPVFRLRGNLLALVELNAILGLEATLREEDVHIVVLQADERHFGLLVDVIHDTEEIVVKPLSRELKGLNAYAGATIMGDGRIALILDVTGIAERAGVATTEGRVAIQKALERREAATAKTDQLLLFSGSDGSRMALPLDAVARLEEFSRGQIERVRGEDFVQYRGEILPLLYLSELFGGTRRELDHRTGERLRVVVHTSGGSNVGFVVDEIEDIVEVELGPTRKSARSGILGSTIIQGRVTDLLDADALRVSAENAG
jgi:two-component system chemotaxis sensor kinase CheA